MSGPVRLKRASYGYCYPPLGLIIKRVELGGHWAPKQVWWEINSDNSTVLAQNLADVRQFVIDIEAARS